jgi:hypothetical protein
MQYCLSLLAQFMEDYSERVQGDCTLHQGHFVSAYARTHVPSIIGISYNALIRRPCLSKSPAYTALMGDIETRLRQARAGGAVRRSETFFIPIASCLQGTILVPTPARLPARSRSRLTAVTGHGSRPTPARLRRSQVTGHRSRVTAVAGALSRVTAVTGHGGHAVTAVTRRLTQTHAGVSRLPS